jgi:phosphoglycolate phosphatase-like HAD superfamily hydrolase
MSTSIETISLGRGPRLRGIKDVRLLRRVTARDGTLESIAKTRANGLAPMTHVIWDWNGTLLDDFPAIMAAVNEALVALGEQPVAPEQYRDHYTRPVQRFYERLLGRAIAAPEWEVIDRDFHDAYRKRMHAAPLARDGLQALQTVAAAGGTQSLLSMLRHEELMAALRDRDVTRHMLHVEGLRGGAGDRKAPHMARHLKHVMGLRSELRVEHCVVVGDSLDDAMAAGEVGLRCVLYDGGSHHRRELEQAGVPVADGLVQALQLAEVL